MHPATANPVFDQLIDAARSVVLSGEHQRDEPPVDGGRWPVTIVARPPGQVRDRLEQLMLEAVGHAGAKHFRTGRLDASHLTIRSLEPYREAASPDDPISRTWAAAMARAARATAPLQFRLTGVTLSKSGVLAQVEALDELPWRFMDRLRDELGNEAWYEDQWMRRNIWYSTILHFAADLDDPAGLVDWVRSSRSLEPVEFTIDTVELVRSRYVEETTGERLMRPETWVRVPLGRG